jgi:hypothetical protein
VVNLVFVCPVNNSRANFNISPRIIKMSIKTPEEYSGESYYDYVREELAVRKMSPKLILSASPIESNRAILQECRFFDIHRYYDPARWTLWALQQYIRGNWEATPQIATIRRRTGPTAFNLPPPSEEQAAVIAAVADHSVILNAVAGAGKTTTILHIAAAYPETPILSITYNAKLKIETREKVDALGLENIAVHSYNSFGYKYVSAACCRDEGISAFLRTRKWAESPPAYTLLIVDEAQDMTELFFQFLLAIIERCGIERICLLGDDMQCIYSTLKGSDARFLTMAQRKFGMFALWKSLTLSTSYRVSAETAEFVNSGLIRRKKLQAHRVGPKPIWWNVNSFNDDIATLLLEAINRVGAGEVFVLAPSIKKLGSGNSPAVKLANKLAACGVPIYAKQSEAPTDEEVLAGKLYFGSFHSVKGLEREVVFLLGIDDSYFEYYDRRGKKTACPHVIYVAATRARSLLICIKDIKRAEPQFADITGEIATLRGPPPTPREPKVIETRPPPPMGVVEFIKICPQSVLDAFMEYVEIEVVEPAGEKISVPSKKRFDYNGTKVFEEVADIIGCAAVIKYMLSINRNYSEGSKLLFSVGKFLNDIGDAKITERFDRCWELSGQTKTEGVYKWAALLDSFHSHYTHRLRQITTFTGWQANMRRLVANIRGIVEKYSVGELSFEELAMREDESRVFGFVDILAGETVWELKCVDHLSTLHELQLAIYAWLRGSNINYLYNMRTGELRSLRVIKDLRPIVDAIYCHRHHTDEKSDDAFLAGGVQFTFCDGCSELYGVEGI